MEEKIIIFPVVAKKLKKIETVLFKNEYFGFKDSAKKYIDKIIDTIFLIPELKHSKTKNPKRGEWYVRHKANDNTTYYITFDTKGERFLVKNIVSNHEKAYSKIIGKN